MSTLPPGIDGVWIHSHEEDQGDLRVYRREGFAFPPSRGRRGFEIRPDGTFITREIGRDDRTVQRPGRWSADASGGIRVAFDDHRPARELRVESFAGDVLRLREEPSFH